MRRSKFYILIILICTIVLSSCTDPNAKADETNKFLFEDYSQYILNPNEINNILLDQYSNPVTFTEEEQAAINKYKNTTLTIGIPTDVDYLTIIDNNYIGINYYTALQLEKDLGLKFEYIFAPAQELLNISNELDIVTGGNDSVLSELFNSPNYESYGYVTDPYFSMNYSGYSKSLNISSTNIREALQYKTAIFMPFAESKIINDNNLTSDFFPHLAQTNDYSKLINNPEYEFLILPENSVAPKYGYNKIDFTSYTYTMLSSFIINENKFDNAFVNAVNKTINPLKEQNLDLYHARVELLKLTNGYFFTPEEKEYLSTNPTINTKLLSNLYPFTFYDKNTNLYNGQLVTILNRIEDITSIDINILHPGKDVTVSEMMSNLYNDDIDLGVGLQDSFDRMFYTYFSNQIFIDESAIIGYKDSLKESTDIYNYNVGVVSNSYIEHLATNTYPSKDFVKYLSDEQAYEDLASGKIDYFITSNSMYYYLVNKYSDFELKNVYTINLSSSPRFATPRNEEGKILINIINKCIPRIELDQVINTNYPLSEIDTVGTYRNILFLRILGSCIFALAIVVIYMLIQAKRFKTKNNDILALNATLDSAFRVAKLGISRHKLGTDYIVLTEGNIALMGLQDEDVFINDDTEKCATFETLVNNYYTENPVDTLFGSVPMIINAIKDITESESKEYSFQVAVKYAKNPQNIIYFDTIVKVDESNPEWINIVSSDITKEVLFQRYEQSIISSDNMTNAKSRSSAYKIDILSHLGKTVAYIDLDNFNLINITYGHSKGNSTLADIANILLNYKHSSEVYRMNGDEFFITLDKFSDDIAIELSELLKQKIEFNNHEINISASIGFFKLIDAENLTIDEVVNISNFAMTKAKENGKNRYVVVDDKMFEDYKRANMLDSLLKNAISDGEIIPYFQPYVDVFSDKVVGYETLMRWKTSDGVLSPFLFLSIAIKSGDIYDIDLLMFKQAALFLKRLQDEGLADETFVASSNFTPITLVRVKPDELVRIVNEIGVHPKNMTIEVTEQLFASDKAFEHIKLLKSKGFSIALDDFSVGHSSMSYLKRLSVDVLKIDKTLIDDTNDSTNLEIYKTVVNLGKSLNAKIVSEGVETSEQVAVLKDCKVHIAQGYYYTKPNDINSTHKFIKEKNK